MVISASFAPEKGPIIPVTITPFVRFPIREWGDEAISLQALITTGNYPIIVNLKHLTNGNFLAFSRQSLYTPLGDEAFEKFGVMLEIATPEGEKYRAPSFVLGVPLPSFFPDCLLGRDFLRAFNVNYRGSDSDGLGQITLSKIDFSENAV